MLDLLIINGLIIDGTGSPAYRGAVGVEDDTARILRGDVSSVDAARTIDATGHVVCPGFIDIHAHSALMPLAEPRHEPKVRQGVTTELIGVDGLSYAPFRSQEDLKHFMEHNSGIEGNPDLPETWSTVAEYLDLFDKKVAINIAYVVGNSPIRINAMSWDNRPASGSDLENMKAMVRESMEEGAFGLSTGLDYPPGKFADTDELVELCKPVADMGGIYHTHVRYTMGDRFLAPIVEALEIGRRSGAPVHITHLAQRRYYPSAREFLQVIEVARESGQDVTFDALPLYPTGSRILIFFPDWVQEGGPEKLKEILRSEEGRKRLREEIESFAVPWQEIWLTNFTRPENKKYEGRSMTEIVIMRGQNPVDAMCDFLLEDGLQISMTSLLSKMETLPDFLAHPLSMISSDAILLGDFPTPVTYGAFPTVLGKYVREEHQMTLPEAIRKMTSFPAQRLGISDRGVLRDGMKADIAIFDPKEVRTATTRTNPKQYPVGIPYVIVNGSVVVDEGSHTGETAGRALKHGQGAR
jgi:N-acyl-D-amino-acid deacylase